MTKKILRRHTSPCRGLCFDYIPDDLSSCSSPNEVPGCREVGIEPLMPDLPMLCWREYLKSHCKIVSPGSRLFTAALEVDFECKPPRLHAYTVVGR